MGERPKLPLSLESLTAGWLTSALRASEVIGPGQRVVHVMRAGAPGLAASSQVVRLILDVLPSGGGEPESVVAKIQARSGGDRALYKREHQFYHSLAAGSELPVPRCYYADIDASGARFVLLLEDLCGVSPGNPIRGCSRAEVAVVLRCLADVHARFWGGRTLQYLGWSPNRYGPGDMRGFRQGFRQAWRSLGENHRWPIPVGLDRAGPALGAQVGEALHRLNVGPITLVHRDLHVENLLLDERGGETKLYIVDWQGAVLGHPAMDLAYAVAGNARTEAVDPSMLRIYHDRLAELGVTDYAYEALMEDYLAGVIWLFAGQVRWLADYTPESRADRKLVLQQWARVAAAAERIYSSRP